LPTKFEGETVVTFVMTVNCIEIYYKCPICLSKYYGGVKEEEFKLVPIKESNK